MDSLEVLQYKLGEWARWVESWKPKLGYPNRVPFVSLMKPSLVHDGDGCDERIDSWAMQVIDASIESLPPVLTNAIYDKYLKHLYNGMVEQAELRLMPIVEKKGLLLI